MKRSSLGFRTNIQKRWKYNSLKSGQFWKFGYELLPDEVIAKITECISDKPCRGRATLTLNQYRDVASKELNCWVREKIPIPVNIARRLFQKLTADECFRLQLTKPIQVSLSASNVIPSRSTITYEPSEESLVEVGDQLSDGYSSEDDFDIEEPEHRPSTTRELGTSLRQYEQDHSDIDIDPSTGMYIIRPTITQIFQRWLANELTVSKRAFSRLLRLMHRYRPTIDVIDYSDETIPTTADALLTIKRSEHNYIIRDFEQYDAVLDDFPDNCEGFTTTGSDESESEVEEDDEEEDEQEDKELIEIGDCPRTLFNDSGNEGDDRSSEDDSEEVPVVLRHLPNSEDYADDMKQYRSDRIGGGVEQISQKMVYFGLENILTLSNSAGNLNKGSYCNFLRAIAIMDETSLTDEMVDRLFPAKSEVSAKSPVKLVVAPTLCKIVVNIKLYIYFALQFKPSKGKRKKEFEVYLDLFHDGMSVFKCSKAPKCTPLMGKLL
jgi:hypothetical protein